MHDPYYAWQSCAYELMSIIILVPAYGLHPALPQIPLIPAIYPPLSSPSLKSAQSQHQIAQNKAYLATPISQ